MPPALGELLRRHRVGAGLTQPDLAARAGISVRALREIEHGRVAPPPETVRRLAEVLRVGDALLRGPAVRVGVLGPLTVHRGPDAVPLGSPMVRSLLGLLAVQPHHRVGRDEIVDTLWGDNPPRTSQASVHVHIGRLRTLLAPHRERRAVALIGEAAGGYVFEPAADQLDLAEFDALVARAGAEGTCRATFDLLGAALDLWRGPALADADPRLAAHPAVTALAGRRLAAALAYADAAMALDRPDRAAGGLRALSHAEPLHEALHARLLVALAAAGQQAAALALFAELRTRLSDELGVDPGPELTAAHLRVLRRQVPTPVAAPPGTASPAQLPGTVRAFAGRAELLRRLDASLVTDRPGEVPIVALTGTPGVGKTALAVHWAHTARDRFPDGQLFVDLHGYSPSPPMRPIDVLAQFLRALGVASGEVPADVAEASGLYRSLLAGKRLLVVLDNARCPDQVRPLLPGVPGCAVLVTSRDQLVGLVARDGVRRFEVDVLAPGESAALLADTIGRRRVQAEPDAARELASACAHLPLALRIAAANLGSRPHASIAGYLDRLRTGNGLAALTVGGDGQVAVRAAFDISYAALPPAARRLFRLIGLAPGPDLAAELVPVLADGSAAEAEEQLDTLCAAHLVSQPAPGRYALHDLLRLYAAERAHAEEPDDERRSAQDRVSGWYLGHVGAAAALLYPERLRLPLPAGVKLAGFDGPTEALRWLDIERANLIALCADQSGSVAWLLADGLRGYCAQNVPTAVWLGLARSALVAAERDRDPCGLTSAHTSLAEVLLRQGRHDEAIAHYRRAVDHSVAGDWVAAQAAALGSLGSVCRMCGRLAEAVEHLSRSLELNRRTGRVAGEAGALGSLGICYREQGELDLAVAAFTPALALFRRLGAVAAEAVALENLGEAYHAQGRLADAERCLDTAVDLFARTGSRRNEASATTRLAALYRDTGRADRALDLVTRALAVGRDTADSRLEMDALRTLGSVHARAGRYRAAADLHHQALDLARQSGSRYPEAQALVALADVYRLRHEPQTAADWARQAMDVARTCGYRLLEAAVGPIPGSAAG